MRLIYRIASRVFYRSPLHEDWLYEKFRRPSSIVALAVNYTCFALRIPYVHRIVSAMVEPVFGCNLRCKTCWGTLDLAGRRPPLLSWAIFCKFVDGLPGSVESIVFSLMGEPLMHPRLHEMIAYAEGKGFRTILFTNGTLLEGENLLRIARSPLSVLSISIETDPENAQKIRGIDLEQIKTHIRAFQAAKNSCTEVKLSLVVHPDNLKHMPTLQEDWKEYATHIKISPQLGIGEPAAEPPLCLEPWRGHLNLYTNGVVSPCCCDWFTSLAIGNLNEQPMKEIVMGAAHRELLRGFLRGEPHPVCLSCREFTVDGAPRRLRKRPFKK